MMDKVDEKIPIWLVFSQNENTRVSLRAICTLRGQANSYRKLAEKERFIVRAWIEQSEANHFFGEMFTY